MDLEIWNIDKAFLVREFWTYWKGQGKFLFLSFLWIFNLQSNLLNETLKKKYWKLEKMLEKSGKFVSQ